MHREKIPELIEPVEEELDYQLISENSSGITWVDAFTGVQVLGMKSGDFFTNYFILLKLYDFTLSLAEEIIKDPEYEPEIKAACFIMAFHFAIHTLCSDLLLWPLAEVAAEIKEKIYKMSLSSNACSWSIVDIIKKIPKFIAKSIFYLDIYLSFAMQSVMSSVGALALFPNNLFGTIVGIASSGMITEFGIFYSHTVFSPKIEAFVEFVQDVMERPGFYALEMARHPLKSLQVTKVFCILAANYSTMGAFLLSELVDFLGDKLGFISDGHRLNIAMGFSGFIILLSTIALRFTKTVDKYFPGKKLTKKSQNTRLDIFLECLISAASLTIFARRYHTYPTMAVSGIVASLISLVVGLSTANAMPAEKKLVLTEPASDSEIKAEETEEISKLAKWLNANSRFVKSVLPYLAVEKILGMLKTHSQIDLGLDPLDILCLAIIIGVYTGMNNANMWLSTIDGNYKYLKLKWAILKEDKDIPYLSRIHR